MDETLVTSSEPPPSDGDPMDVVTEPHNPNDNQSASSSDSDSESDDEAQAALELQTLETELSTNPANYDAHVQVCLIIFTCLELCVETECSYYVLF